MAGANPTDGGRVSADVTAVAKESGNHPRFSGSSGSLDCGDKLSSFFSGIGFRFLSVTGSGGKTSLVSLLSSSMRAAGKRVLITTTTKIQSPESYDWKCDRFFGTADAALSADPVRPCADLFATPRFDGKLESPSFDDIAGVSRLYDAVLSEADGSRGLPFKIHTDRDPVIHPLTDFTVALIGMWGFGTRVRDSVFGAPDGPDAAVDAAYVQALIDRADGALKGTLPGRSAVLLNAGLEFWSGRTFLCDAFSFPRDAAVLFASVMEDRIFRSVMPK